MEGETAEKNNFQKKWVTMPDGMVDVTASVAAFTRNEAHQAVTHFERLMKLHFKGKPSLSRANGLAMAARTLVLLYHKLKP